MALATLSRAHRYSRWWGLAVSTALMGWFMPIALTIYPDAASSVPAALMTLSLGSVHYMAYCAQSIQVRTGQVWTIGRASRSAVRRRRAPLQTVTGPQQAACLLAGFATFFSTFLLWETYLGEAAWPLVLALVFVPHIWRALQKRIRWGRWQQTAVDGSAGVEVYDEITSRVVQGPLAPPIWAAHQAGGHWLGYAPCETNRPLVVACQPHSVPAGIAVVSERQWRRLVWLGEMPRPEEGLGSDRGDTAG